MPLTLTRDELIARLVRAGELEVSGEDQAETDTYFDTENFMFHGPDSFDADYQGLPGPDDLLPIHPRRLRRPHNPPGHRGCRGQYRRVPNLDRRNVRPPVHSITGWPA
jgi:hypothetical protein